jgi:glyoxylase-like metal-dependent hydrolase (beta-lactamase superfamily II)
MRAYLSSLRRVHAANPARLYPGHGPVIEDPRATCGRLIAHRLDREQSVERAVRAGARTLDEVVDTAYEKDISAVYDLARATVLAHLEKLAVEKRVQFDGERAAPV